MAEEPGRPAPPTAEKTAAAIPDPRIGRVLQDRYRITGIIAAGGMGIVYRGERIGLGKVVAIKFLHATMARDPMVARRFEVEARAMSRLGHPNCVGVLDFGVDDLPYVVIDYAAGESLDVIIAQGALAPRRAIKIVRQILAALAHAHAQGIVHRDIKPENIVVEQNPGLADHVRLLDFGLAKLVGADQGLTAGLAIGTPHYMAPEQMSEGPVDGRADLYSAGIVLFELLTGQKPFDAPELSTLLLQHLGTPPPPLRQVAPWTNFSGPLEAVVMRAMSKRAEQRYPSADAMSAALDDTPEAMGTPGPEVVGPPFASAPAMATSSRRIAHDATVPWSSAHGIMVPGQPKTLGPEVPPAAPEPHAHGQGHRRWFIERPFWLAASAGLGATLLAGAMVVLGFSGRADAPAPLPPAAAEATLTSGAVPARKAAPSAPALASTVPSGVPSTRENKPLDRRVAKASSEDPAARALAAGGEAFADKRPLVGLAAYRQALRLDPHRRGDATMIKTVINALGGDKSAACAAFLRELGGPALPALRVAARSHNDAKVRAAAADLISPPSAKATAAKAPAPTKPVPAKATPAKPTRPPAKPDAPKPKPFLRWL